MRRRFFDLAFTPAVKAVQSRRGSRAAYARAEAAEAPPEPGLTLREAAFIGTRDSFYLASVSETGWPYLQHRGGPRGFVRILDERTIGWAELRGVPVEEVAAAFYYVRDGEVVVHDDLPGREELEALLTGAPASR